MSIMIEIFKEWIRINVVLGTTIPSFVGWVTILYFTWRLFIKNFIDDVFSIVYKYTRDKKKRS